MNGKTKILIVDDKPENLLALSNLLAAPDVEIISATSGESALSLILDHDFGLALFDVQMPLMTGFELARLVRGVERSRRLPIIFVTAERREPEVVFEGYETGAVDFLFKPLDTHVVRNKVRVFVDLDQQRKALREQYAQMESLKEAAESANQAKTRFLASMSHEIRTPLGAVLGFAELMRDPKQSETERLSCVEAIDRNGHLLLRLIDDILDFSKIEADRMELEKMTVSLVDLVTDVKAALEHRAQEKKVALEFLAERPLPAKFTSDPLRLKQILNNIIGNAIKFTDKGRVEVRISMDANRKLLRFAVIDTGVGLSSDAAAKLFRPFTQADSSTKRKFGGTGLGLAISRRLARALGGDVELTRAKPREGSTFTITVNPGKTDGEITTDWLEAPRDVPARPVPHPAQSSGLLAGRTILIVDDSSDNQVLIQSFLRLVGAQARLASNGFEAIETALRENFDAVLMDIQMPGMDGYEATTKLRAQGYGRPIIALTAHAMQKELDRCLEVGCNAALRKPLDRNLLFETLERCLDCEAKPSAPTA